MPFGTGGEKLALFFAVSAIVLCVETLRNRSVFNMTLLISGPYILIVFLNNFFMKYWGYDVISEDALTRYSFLILLVFIGGFVCDLVLPKYYGFLEKREQNALPSGDENVLGKIRIYLCLVVLVRLANVFTVVWQLGVQGIVESDFEALNMSGIPGHLMLTGYVLVPYLFDSWLERRNKKDMLVMLVFFVTSFLSFVKYQIIIILVILFVFYCFKHSEKSGRALGILIAGAVGIFLLSYVVSFLMQDLASIGMKFYLSRLWTYISGGTSVIDSLIRDGYTFSFAGEWLPSHVGALGNLAKAFIGSELYEIPEIGYHTIGYLAPEGDVLKTNVFSEFAYLSLLSSPWITAALGFLTGFFNQFLFQTGRRTKNNHLLILLCLLLSIHFLGFFSNYYTLSAIWELIFFALVLIPVFRLLPSVRMKR